ncbi:MAG: 50S ribosomal protein L17 [bacterium]|nr:50S ribosomal protein L17 [bacterium]
MKRAFSRQKDHREHMLRNLATSLVLYEKIDTTMPKAKELKSFIDHILADSKKADLTTIRNLNKVFFDKNAVKKVIEVLVPRYAERSSGFTRTFSLQNRAGDNASMMRIELIDKKVFVENTEVSDLKSTEKKDKKKVITNEK